MVAAVVRENSYFPKLRCFNYKSVSEFDTRIIFK